MARNIDQRMLAFDTAYAELLRVIARGPGANTRQVFERFRMFGRDLARAARGMLSDPRGARAVLAVVDAANHSLESADDLDQRFWNYIEKRNRAMQMTCPASVWEPTIAAPPRALPPAPDKNVTAAMASIPPGRAASGQMA